MKLPVSWLAEFIDISDMSIQELADKITFAGIEIEGIEQVGPCFDNIVAAEVRECVDHPNSDHLHITKVWDGENEYQVVCGAPNCRAGLITPLAKIGAKVPNGGFEIKKGKLRGVESNGMLCSASELSLSSDHSGIMELDPSIKPGTKMSDLYGSSETVFDVEITWNRADCLSIIGIAREFSAILGRPLKMPDIDYPVLDAKASDLCSVKIEDFEKCPNYTARVLPHVERLPSPEFMRKRLELCGQRSIDIVVDVSNYVMLECGQPLHTFDYECVADHSIIVRTATDGEKIKTLDDVERTLDSSMLVIADTNTPLAVAGVMGGEGSEIRPNTSSVLLESASFYAPSIKSTATSLQMRTEASHRYERGVDPYLTDWASRRACHLLVKYANATVAEGVVSEDARAKEPLKVTLRYKRVNDVIGMDIPVEKQLSILTSLAFVLESKSDTEATFVVPTYRLDVDCEADLIEEIARMNGLDALPDVLPATTIVPDANDAPIRAASICRRTLVDIGFTEIMNYSFTAPATLDAFQSSNKDKRVVLPNPVSADHSVMRDSLIPQMLETLSYNNSHGTNTARMFEMGRVFYKDAKGVLSEEDRVCIGIMGYAGRNETDCIRPVESSEALLWIKGAFETLTEKLHTPAVKMQAMDMEGFDKGCSAVIYIAGRPAGVIGILDANTRKKRRIASPLAVIEVRREPLLANTFKNVSAKDVPTFPGSTRDIALIADGSVTNEQIIQTIKKAAPAELASIKLFDIFKDKKLGNKTSLAYSLEYRSAEKTLTDEEVNTYHNKIREALKTKLPIEIRE